MENSIHLFAAAKVYTISKNVKRFFFFVRRALHLRRKMLI
jgi:hypothetical protein